MKLSNEQKNLVEDHYKLAMKLAHNYYKSNKKILDNKKLDWYDIAQITSEELCRLAMNYDSEKCKFSTYIYSFLILKVQREVERYNIIKIPFIHTWNSNLHKDMVDDYKKIYTCGLLELDRPLNTDEDSDTTLGEILKDDTQMDRYNEILIDMILDESLNKKNYEAMKLYVEGHRVHEIHQKLKIGRGAASNRIKRSKKILKRKIENGLITV